MHFHVHAWYFMARKYFDYHLRVLNTLKFARCYCRTDLFHKTLYAYKPVGFSCMLLRLNCQLTTQYLFWIRLAIFTHCFRMECVVMQMGSTVKNDAPPIPGETRASEEGCPATGSAESVSSGATQTQTTQKGVVPVTLLTGFCGKEILIALQKLMQGKSTQFGCVISSDYKWTAAKFLPEDFEKVIVCNPLEATSLVSV